MASVLEFDEQMSRWVEAMYKTEDAARRRRAVLEALVPSAGERVIDIGTGPGFLAREIAGFVGPTGEVLGVDISEPMLQLARARCADLAQVRFESADAASLPAPDAHFDVASSVQVFEYVGDVEAALVEMLRILRPGGRGAIVTTDWRTLAWNSSDEGRMQRVMRAFAEHCAHQDLPRRLGPKLRSVGFEVVREQVLPQFNPTFDANTYSALLAVAVASFVPGRAGVTADEAVEWASDIHRTGAQGEYFFCLNQYLFSVVRPAAS
jgi:ubiquinone/menaquinone biosynthesis C-methylase UbiE